MEQLTPIIKNIKEKVLPVEENRNNNIPWFMVTDYNVTMVTA